MPFYVEINRNQRGAARIKIWEVSMKARTKKLQVKNNSFLVGG